MDYRVACDTEIGALIKEVKELMADGYTPQGGIAVAYHKWTNERKGYEESAEWFYQAMVKLNAPAVEGTTTTG